MAYPADTNAPGYTNQKGTEVIHTDGMQTIANHPGPSVHNLTREDLENRIDELETLLYAAADEIGVLLLVLGQEPPDETVQLLFRIGKSL